MPRIEFSKLRATIRKPGSSTTRADSTSDSLNELLNVLCNFIPHTKELDELELSMLIMSLQDYITNRKKIGDRHSANPICVGDIFYADLGLNYVNEIAYSHPVIVLEKLGEMLFIVPVTTSTRFLSTAYHPIDNPAGDRSYRKINMGEDGLSETSAVILNNARSVYNYRLVNKVGSMQDITNHSSIFQEIKTQVFKFHHPEVLAYLTSLEKDKENLEEKLNDLQSEILKLQTALEAMERMDKSG